MGNLQQRPRSSSPWSDQRLGRTRRSVDDRVLTLRTSDVEFGISDARRSLPRRFSWSPRCYVDGSADELDRCFSIDRRLSASRGGTYNADRLLSPTALLDEIYRQRPSSCRAADAAAQSAARLQDVTAPGRQDCDEGAASGGDDPRMMDSAARTTADSLQGQPADCFRGDTGTCRDVIQRRGDESGRADDVDAVSSHSSDNEISDDDTPSSSQDDEHSGSDDHSDDDNDADDADDDNDDDTLDAEVSSVSDDEDDTAHSGYPHTSIVAQRTSVASQTAPELLDIGSEPVAGRELCDASTQTELRCPASFAQHQQPTAPTAGVLREPDERCEHGTWACNNDDNEAQGSSSWPCNQERAVSLDVRTSSFWSAEKQRVHSSQHVDEHEATPDVESRRFDYFDVTLSASVAAQSDGDDDNNHIGNTSDTQQQNESKMNDVDDLNSAFSDDDNPVRDTPAADGLLQNHGKNACWHESVTQTTDFSADLNLSANRNRCTWHADLDRNTRIWKLMVSHSVIWSF